MLAALIAALAVVAVLVWREATSSTEVSAADAVAGFRERPAERTRPGHPAPGVYVYDAAGRQSANVGPVAVDRDVPDTARAVVAPGPDGLVDVEWRISEEHTEGYRYAVGGGWWTMTWRRVELTFLGIGRDDRRDVVPPARWLPASPRVGARWPVAFRTGTLDTRGEGRVVRRTTLPLDGRREPVLLVRTVTRTTGALAGTRREDVWWSPRLAMPVRLVSDTRLEGVAGYRSRLDLTLRTGVPER